jgi:formylmethanofuran dehydrogenase subunit E
MATTHDVFTCHCHETCSWCTEPVLNSSLRETNDGARICRACWAVYTSK